MQFSVEKTHLDGVFLVQSDKHVDERGMFLEAFSTRNIPQIFGGDIAANTYNMPVSQDNVAISEKGVLRGLHIQREKPQGKLVRCLFGRILDVVVDLRPESPTFKQWGSFELNGPTKAIWIPKGFAHGYYSITHSIVYYKCSTLYDKYSDGGINPFDKELGIKWPSANPIMSDKDKNLPSMKEWLKG
jgi:dTDP-4-dehydrorhamnose 3,5-epimerase